MHIGIINEKARIPGDCTGQLSILFIFLPPQLCFIYLENMAELCTSSGLWCSGSRGRDGNKTSFLGSFRLRMLDMEKLVYPEEVVVVFLGSHFVVEEVVVLLPGLE